MKPRKPPKKAAKKAACPSIIHMPSLGTVLMVEDTIKKLDYYPTRNQLWRALPRAVMWQTFNVIVDYLLGSNKIIISRDKHIVWIYVDNPKLKKLFDNAVPYEKVRKVYW